MYNIFPGNDFQRAYNPQIAFLEQKLPEVVGEGDIVSTISPDGTVLFYFSPALRRNPYPFQFQTNINSNFQWPVTPEFWFIRSICNTNPFIYFNNHMLNLLGNQIVPYNSTSNNIFSNQLQYLQKFHNDNATSTSDIHYFYPSLRYTNEKLNICAAVQVETQLSCRCCDCKNINSNHRKVSSEEDMSVDEMTTINHKEKRTKRKTYKNSTCKCEKQCKKSDKLIATYVDTSSGFTQQDGRETQTVQKKYEKSNIQTDEFVPKRSKSKRSRSPIHSCSSGSSCTCVP